MARYIDADLLKSKFEYDNNDSPVYVEATKGIHKIIDACPIADVAPVKHAHWVNRCDYGSNYELFNDYTCSNCNHRVYMFKENYCSNCGAKMDEEVDK